MKASNKQLEVANLQVSALTAMVGELTERIKNLEQMLKEKGIALDKQERITKALGSLVSGKKSEKRSTGESPTAMTEEEYKAKLEERKKKRQARGNNGAKRDEHLEMEVEYVDMKPDFQALGMDEAALRLLGIRECVRYSMVPAKCVKTVFRIYSYTDGLTVYQGRTPRAAFLNSQYDSSFVAYIMEMRYIYSMPVERIIDYLGEHGFALKKPTAHKLLKGGARVLKNIYKAIGETVKQQNYVNIDETYHKVLLEKEKPTDRGVKKAYIWASLAPFINLLYMWYDEGSRREEVFLDEFGSYGGYIQSDAYTIYKKLESDDFPFITRIACLQHIKRKFIACGEDKAAKKIIDIINKLYQKEHKHTIGEKGWTVEKNLAYRQQYAPPILLELKNELESLEPIVKAVPKSDLAEAVKYALHEFSAVCDIFTRGDTALDNNAIERPNRYVSLSRRNSMFFGSHQGAECGCTLYSIAISCRLNGINLSDYIQDVIDKAGGWAEDTPLENYRNLLPDKWQG